MLLRLDPPGPADEREVRAHAFLSPDELSAAPIRRPVSVALSPENDPHILAPHIGALATVRLTFAFLHDGRPYSQARILRHHLGFRGALVASGALVPDLLPHLRACGFDFADIEGDAALLAARLEAPALPAHYDPRAPRSIWRLRHPEIARGEKGPVASGP